MLYIYINNIINPDTLYIEICYVYKLYHLLSLRSYSLGINFKYSSLYSSHPAALIARCFSGILTSPKVRYNNSYPLSAWPSPLREKYVGLTRG